MVQFEDMEADEKLAWLAGMNQWRNSLKRPDLQEEDRVKGALLAYQRQIFAFKIADAAASLTN